MMTTPALTLTDVFVFHRHGERTALHNPFDQLKANQLCTSPSVLSRLVAESTPTKIKLIRDDPIGVDGSGTRCYPGQLTDTGKASLRKLGVALRERYCDQFKLLPSKLNADLLSVKSTEIPRAIESVASLLDGMYPLEQRDGSAAAVDVIVRNERYEYIYPNYKACPALRGYADGAVRATREKHRAAFAQIQNQLQSHLPTPPGTRALTSHDYFDIFACARAHDTPLPSSVDETMLKMLEAMAVDQWWAPYVNNEHMIRLGIGRLLGELVGQLRTPSPLARMHIYSGHDSTIGPLLAAFGSYDHLWPQFSSHVIVERYEQRGAPNRAGAFPGDTSPPSSSLLLRLRGPPPAGRQQGSPAPADRTFVRVLYNFKPVVVRGCESASAAAGVDPSYCPLNRFVDLTHKYIVQDFATECQQKQPPLPSQTP